MSSRTKIVVLRMKEIIYTAIFIGLAILLITCFCLCSAPENPLPAPRKLRKPGKASRHPTYLASILLLSPWEARV